jgi:fatty acid desaturase
MACSTELANALLAAVIIAIQISIFCGPLFLGGRLFALFSVIVLLFALATPAHWGLVHEGIHGRLWGRPLRNRLVGRILAVLLGFSFDVVQFGHLMHHRYNGHEFDRPDRIKPGEPLWKSLLRHYSHLFGWHYIMTAAAGILAFAPASALDRLLNNAFCGGAPELAAIHTAAAKWVSSRGRIQRIRVDFAISLAILAVVFVQYGRWWPVLFLALGVRALIYSVLDNLPHYGRDGKGEVPSANLKLAPWASVVVLSHNHHGIHHDRPDLDWRMVAKDSAQVKTDGGYLAAALVQFKGPVHY